MRSLLWFSQPKEFKHLHLHLPPPPYHQTTTTVIISKNGVTTEEWNATKKPQKNIPRKLNTASSLYHHQNYFTLFLCVFNETLSNFLYLSKSTAAVPSQQCCKIAATTHQQSLTHSLPAYLSLWEIVFVGLAELFFFILLGCWQLKKQNTFLHFFLLLFLMIMITKQIKNTDDDTEKIYSGFVLLTNH